MKRARVLLILLVLSLLFGLATGLPLFYRLAYALALFLLGGFVWTVLALRGLAVEARRSPTRLQVGEAIEVRLTLRNRGLLPKPWLEVEDLTTLPGLASGRVVNLPGRGFRSWKAQVVARQRGVFQMGPVRVVAGDPFGLFRLQRLFAALQEVVVYPRTLPLPFFHALITDLPGEGPLRQRVLQVSPHASSVRDYQPGDALTRIHWPSTARTGRLMVKEFDLGLGSALWLVLDLQREVHAGAGEESTEEFAMTIAASVGRRYLEVHWPVGVVGYGGQRNFLEAERGEGHLFRLLEHLALARAEGDLPLAEALLKEEPLFGRYATLVVITPSLRTEWVEALDYLTRRGARAVVVLLDAPSFGGRGDVSPVTGRLQEAGLPFYLVRRGDDLSRTLAQPLNVRPAGVRV